MYHDCEFPLGTTPPFRVDFLTGIDAKESGACVECLPLSQLYFCDGCSRLVSRRDLAEDVESYYCPNCLENMPSSEAMLYGMRCSKCWECPVCSSTLSFLVLPTGSEQCHYLACGYCRWNSKGRLEAAQPEILIKKITDLEKEAEPRQRMCTLVDAFRYRVQEQQREREYIQRMRRRSSLSRGSFLAGMAGKRLGAMRKTKATLGDRPSGPWRLEDIEAKQQEQEDNRLNLRADPKQQKLEQAEKEKQDEPDVADSADAEKKEKGDDAAKIVVPILEGLTVDDLLKAHDDEMTLSTTGRRSSLRAEMQSSLEEDSKIVASLSSLNQRMQQVAHGYDFGKGGQNNACASSNVESASGHVGRLQIEAPLQSIDMWSLLPVRKALLTKRSRRCRLAGKEGAAPAANLPPTAPRHSSLARKKVDAAEPASQRDSKQCSKIVVRPQINPCSNPPFQKNNIAVSFIPQSVAWAWRRDGGSTEGESGSCLRSGEKAELYVVITNPLDSEVQIDVDPTKFNPSNKGEVKADNRSMQAKDEATDEPTKENVGEVAKGECTGKAVGSKYEEKLFSSMLEQQNVDVLTPPFQTTMSKCNDLADVHELLGDDAEKAKQLKQMDNPDIIVERKLNKLVIKLRFQGLDIEALKKEGKHVRPSGSWVFYVQIGLSFKDVSSGQHNMKIIQRFSTEKVSVLEISSSLRAGV